MAYKLLREGDDGTAMRALLYHPERPCANPGRDVMMNKQQANGVRTGSWLTG
jgi:hypothetical protein